MKALLALAAVASFWGAATAFDGMPPRQYQGDLTIQTSFVEFSQIAQACGYPELAPGKGRYEGCNQPGRLVLPNPCSGEFAGEKFAQLACHEKGHALGWPANHPDALGYPQGRPMMEYMKKP